MKINFQVGKSVAGKRSDYYNPRYETTQTDKNFYIWVPMKIGKWTQVARFTLSEKFSPSHSTAGWWEIVIIDPTLDYHSSLDPKALHISIVTLFRDGIANLQRLE
jgi:hypothetical protein